MIGFALLAVLAAAPVDPAALEVRAAELVDHAFAAAHLHAPARDAALSLAARELASELLAGKLSKDHLAEAAPTAISRAGGWDPAPRSLVLAGNRADSILQYLAAQPSLTEDQPDQLGVGVAVGGERVVLLVVTARRLAEVKPFPRNVPVGARARLEVSLRPPLHAPQLVVTGPDGRAQTSTDAVAAGLSLQAALRFSQAGRYTVEVMGRSAAGPQVAAIFRVESGQATTAEDDEDGPEPADPIAKIEAVLARINRVRAKAKLKPLQHDRALDLLALEHSEDMAVNHYFAHVSPAHGDLHARLAGRYAYVRAGENLGEAPGALAAERAIEGSPAHLENTLDPGFTHLGLALYPNAHPGGEVTLLLTEIFATPPPPLADPAGAIAQALNQARAARRLATLGRDATLDRVAREHVKQMVADGMPGGERDAQDAAIEADPNLKSVAVDIFVGSVPEDALRSRNALSTHYNRMGIAAQVVPQSRFGAGRLWICVLYARVGG